MFSCIKFEFGVPREQYSWALALPGLLFGELLPLRQRIVTFYDSCMLCFI